jgi:hypothetical protein
MWTKDMIAAARKALAPWQGGYARLWYYAASHSQLHLLITKADRGGQLHFVCEGCKHITAPTVWSEMMLNITPVDDEDKHIIVSDDVAGFRVVCSLVSTRGQVDDQFHGPE